MLATYLETSGLTLSETQQHWVVEYLPSFEQTLANTTYPVRIRFQVPVLGEGGTCSLFGELDDTPFSLTQCLGAITDEKAQMLSGVQALVTEVVKLTQSPWFGVYAKLASASGFSLFKLAYFGAESRAEFPLTEQYAQISNNVQVGLSGTARLINQVQSYVAGGGEYYTCDPKVQAEACFPILAADGQLLGIIDAEAFSENFYNDKNVAILVAACLALAQHFQRFQPL